MDLLGTCEVVPQEPRHAAVVATVVAFFDLNRMDLCRERIRCRDELVRALEDGAVERQADLACRHAPHSLVALTLLREAGRALPTPAHERRAQVRGALDQLDVAMRLAEREADSTLAGKRRRDVEEALWMLATLRLGWDGVEDDVDGMLEEAGVLDEVQRYRLLAYPTP